MNPLNIVLDETNKLDIDERKRFQDELPDFIASIQSENDISSGIPKLPKRFKELLQGDTRDYCPTYTMLFDFITESSPRSHPLFRVTAAIHTLATIASGRVWIEDGDDGRITDFYFINCAPSSQFAKSEGVKRGYRVMKSIGLDYLHLPDRMSASRFYTLMLPLGVDDMLLIEDDELREKQKKINKLSAQRSLFIDELGPFLHKIVENTGDGDWSQILRRIADAPDLMIDDTHAHGKRAIKSPCLNFIGNLTPSDFSAMNKKLLYRFKDDGFWARFWFAIPSPEDKRGLKRTRKQTPIPEQLTKNLTDWFNSLPMPEKGQKEFPRVRYSLNQATDSIHINFDMWLLTCLSKEQESLLSSYTRHATKIIKLAGLFASVNGKNIITEREYILAMQIGELFRNSLHRFMDMIDNPQTPNKRKEQEEYIIKRLRAKAHKNKLPMYTSSFCQEIGKNSLFQSLERTYIMEMITKLSMIDAIQLIEKGKKITIDNYTHQV